MTGFNSKAIAYIDPILFVMKINILFTSKRFMDFSILLLGNIICYEENENSGKYIYILYKIWNTKRQFYVESRINIHIFLNSAQWIIR